MRLGISDNLDTQSQFSLTFDNVSLFLKSYSMTYHLLGWFGCIFKVLHFLATIYELTMTANKFATSCRVCAKAQKRSDSSCYEVSRAKSQLSFRNNRIEVKTYFIAVYKRPIKLKLQSRRNWFPKSKTIK